MVSSLYAVSAGHLPRSERDTWEVVQAQHACRVDLFVWVPERFE